jgi:hypothetical protein
MDIFYKRWVTNIECLNPDFGVIKLTYNDGYTKTHTNTVYSVHKNPDGSGHIHLFQDGAGGSIGYWGHQISVNEPLTFGGVTMTDPDDVLDWCVANILY